jgi:peptidoglycan/LPS O-acetylase OafA/YrhL
MRIAVNEQPIPRETSPNDPIGTIKPRQSARIPELDGLRAFAVISVVVYHIITFARSESFGSTRLGYALARFGTSGVNIFFIISGFIITSLLVREQASTARVSLKAFYIRRCFRILPPFAAYLFAVFVIGSLGLITMSKSSLVVSALFLGNASLFGTYDNGSWFVAHTWSLSVEEQFYLIFPPVLCLIFRFRFKTTLVALCLMYLFCMASVMLSRELANHFGPTWLGVAGLHDFRYIIVGVFLALYGRPILSFLSNKPRMLALLLGISIMLLRFFQRRAGILPFLATALEPCLCGLFVMWFAQNPSRCAPLRWSAVQWIGSCSYSIYLWQQFFTGLPFLYHGWNPSRSIVLSSLAIIVCGATSHYLIELPSIRLGRLFSDRLRPQTPKN